ncbi:MAG: N-acetylmuramoyl-L-alanine amidase [Pseudomonadota bacterium]
MKHRFRLTNISVLLFVYLILSCQTNLAHARWAAGGISIPAYSDTPQRACEYLGIYTAGQVIPYRIAWLLPLGGSDDGFYRAGTDVQGPPLPNPENNYTPSVPRSHMYCIRNEVLQNSLAYYPDPKPKIIAIDPGHGGTKCDDGMTGTTGPTYKDTEHALALSIGLSLRDKLTSKGYKVVMTRTTAECPPLQDRVRIATKANADLFVSIHFNGVDNPQTNGTEVFGLPEVPKSWQLATSSSALLSSTLGTVDRGPKTKSLFVIRKATMPAILAEVAFLTNVGGDENIMHRPASPNEAASAIFSGINQLFNQ